MVGSTFHRNQEKVKTGARFWSMMGKVMVEGGHGGRKDRERRWGMRMG